MDQVGQGGGQSMRSGFEVLKGFGRLGLHNHRVSNEREDGDKYLT